MGVCLAVVRASEKRAEWLEPLDQKPARHYTDGDFIGLHTNIAEAVGQQHIALSGVMWQRTLGNWHSLTRQITFLRQGFA